MSFNKSLFGINSINILLGEKNFYELTLNLTNIKCKDGYQKCPSGRQCFIGDIIGCIPLSVKCDNPEEIKEKPLKCKGTNKCVVSLAECDPERGYKKCNYMKFQYPEGKDYLCFSNADIEGFLSMLYPELCDDGILRKSKDLQPSQIVCPIGTVLCPDLTCRDNLNQRYYDYPECKSNEIRCPDQSCVSNINECPTTKTWVDPSRLYVCSDGNCYPHEIYCPPIKSCPEDKPFLCLNNECSENAESCSNLTACGEGKSLCSNLQKCNEGCVAI